MAEEDKELELSYCLISNIPDNFHSSDLRNFFAVFREQDKFDLFHFRRRPQEVNVRTGGSVERRKRLCALVRFKKEDEAAQFCARYNGKVWMDRSGNELPLQVVVQRAKLSEEDLSKFKNKELSPPALMPKGNVGTPNEHFLKLIRDCKLPPSLISKLGLEFPKGRVFKKYSKVPFDYGTERSDYGMAEAEVEEEEEVRDGRGRVIYGPDDKIEEGKGKENDKDGSGQESDPESTADDDDDRCEEWERHEALNDHRTSHGTMYDEDKERLYEEKIELKWEKGGSGLVFYTDAQVWEAQEEDHDDWDVDMEGYYVEGGGDKDARDYMEMRRSERFQQGLEDFSVFKKKPPPKPRRPASPPIQGPSSTVGGKKKIGSFEVHTRGVGRKIMEKSGWKDGQGLGSTIKGIPDALAGEGQVPSDRRGFGYYGEKMEYTTKVEKNRRKYFKDYCLNPDAPERVVIGTVYDNPSDLDIQEPLKRRNATTFIKRYPVSKESDSTKE